MGQQFLNRIRYYLDSLQRFTKSEHPLMLIIGQQGSGKRPLLEALSQELPDTFRQLTIESNADLTPQDLIDFLCDQWQLQQDPSIHSHREQLNCLLRQINNDQQHNLIICNNAQSLTLATLAALSHLASQQETPPVSAHIILAGENELEDKVNSLMAQSPPRLLMQPLSKKETFHYIKYRLAKLGNTNTIAPSQAIMEDIYNQSGGFPNLIHHITQKWIYETVLDRDEMPDEDSSLENEAEYSAEIRDEDDLPIKRLKEHYQKDAQSFWQRHTIKIITSVCLFLLAIGYWVFYKKPQQIQPQPITMKLHPVATAPTAQQKNLPKSITIESLAAITGIKQAENPQPVATKANKQTLAHKTKSAKAKKIAKINKKPYFAIQLIASNQLARIEKFKEAHKKLTQTDIIWLRKNGATWYALVTGQYPNKKKALVAMKKLPKALQKNHPWVKEIH